MICYIILYDIVFLGPGGEARARGGAEAEAVLGAVREEVRRRHGLVMIIKMIAQIVHSSGNNNNRINRSNASPNHTNIHPHAHNTNNNNNNNTK